MELKNVSRETSEKLRAFEDLVKKWTKRINLVSTSSHSGLWERHILDSAQIFASSDDPTRWADLGSGGGFPGVVVAILAETSNQNFQMTLVESDKRKSAFLMTAARELDLSFQVIPKRIEEIPPMDVDTLSARALAPLADLLGFASLHMHPQGTAIFPKGKNWQQEADDAKQSWSFDLDVIESQTEQSAAILKVRNIRSSM